MSVAIRLLLAANLLLLTACAGSGSFQWDSARQIKQGMTYEQVIRLIGPPYRTEGRGNGVVRYTWVHANGFTGYSQWLMLEIKDNKVMQAPHVPNTLK